MDTTININIKADTSQAAQNVKGFAGTWTELKSKLDLVQEGAQIIGGVFKNAFDLTKEGAMLKDTAASLERLSKAEGYAGNLAEDLGEAFGDTVDDANYMASAIRLLTGETGAYGKELANAAPQLATISRAIFKLNPTLGSTAEIFDAVTRAIETGNVRGLKPYGILVEDTGTKQEILNDILAQGAAVIEQVGGNVEASGDSLARMEMMLDDAKDAAAGFLAEGLLPIADGFMSLRDAMQTQMEAAVTNNLTWEEYLQTLGVAGPVIAVLDPLFGNLAQKQIEAAQATREQEQETTRLLNAVTSADYVTQAWAENVFYAAQALDLQAENTYKAYVSSEKFADRLALVNEKSAEATEKLHDLTPKVEELADTLNQDVGSPLTQFIADIQFFMASGGRNFTKELEGIQNRLAEKIAAEETTPGQAAIAMQDAREEAARLLIDYAKVQVELGKETDTSAIENIAEALGITIDDATKLFTDFDKNADAVFGEERAVNINTASLETLHEKLLAAEGDITSLGEKAKSIEGTYDINFEIHTNGEIPNVGGYGGGHPTGPTTPTASLRVGDTAPTPAGTDWQAVFLSLTEEQRRKVQDMVGTSMYEADYAAAITKVLKNADLNDAARKLDRGGGRTVPRGDAPFDPGGLGGVPLPFSGGGNLAAGGNTIIVMIDGQEVAYRMQTLAGQSLRVASMSGAGMLGQ